MDKYSVKLMSRALRDLDGIYDYIAHTLLEPGTALKLVAESRTPSCLWKRCPTAARNGDEGLTPTEDTDSFLWRITPPFFGLMKQRKP